MPFLGDMLVPWRVPEITFLGLDLLLDRSFTCTVLTFMYLCSSVQVEKTYNSSTQQCSMSGIFTYMWLKISGFHVGKYSSPMDGMGMHFSLRIRLYILRLREDFPGSKPMTLGDFPGDDIGDHQLREFKYPTPKKGGPNWILGGSSHLVSA